VTAELDRVGVERRVIEEARTVPEIAAAVAKLDALETLAKKVGVDHRDQNRIAAAKLEGKRKGGQLLEAMEKSDGGRPPKNSNTDVGVSEYAAALDAASLSQPEASRWQRISRIPEPVFDTYLDELRDDGEREITTAGVIAYARTGKVAKDLVLSDEIEWYTPARYVEAARMVLGGIDLDPATSHAANEVVQAPEIFTIDDDGLAHTWQGRVWLNPPYGRLAGEFVTKLVWDHQTENVSAAVALVNAHCTDTEWFQALWDYTLCFTDHRIDFDANGRDKHTTSTHGSVFAYLGPDAGQFAKVFAEFGTIVRRWP
jgi:hypothetical protein